MMPWKLTIDQFNAGPIALEILHNENNIIMAGLCSLKFGMLQNRSRDGASSLDYRSDTGPVVQDRDRSDWSFRTPVTCWSVFVPCC